MAANPSDQIPTPASIAASVKKYAPKSSMSGMHGSMMMHGPMVSIREDEYKGHHVVVRTTYEIEVDGRPLTGHIDLSNEGDIAYHGLPNMNFDSAIALVESVIDHFPEDFPPGGAPKQDMKGHDMQGMAGMGHKAAPRAAKAVKKPSAAKKSGTAAKSKAKPSGTRKSK